MRKTWKSILACCLVAVTATAATGCLGEETTEIINAYDIAVKNGFVGTEQEWLNSLHGANGKDGEDGASLRIEDVYQAAVENGYEGTLLDFCLALGIENDAQTQTVQIAENMLSVVSVCCRYSVSGSLFNYGSQAGSGVIVDLNKEAGTAYILTNYHVVYGEDANGIVDDIYVYPYGAFNTFDPKSSVQKDDGIRATYVGGAMDYDIAVLKVEGSDYLRDNPVAEAKMGNSDKVRVGEKAYAIGNPLGEGMSVTDGVISVDSETITMSALNDENREVAFRVMRTSAAVNGGNSGGGLFNEKGELIGIVNAKSVWSPQDGGNITMDSAPSENVGYALPITTVKEVYENILANGDRVQQATLGITVSITASKAVLEEDGNVSLYEEFVVSTKTVGSAAEQAFKIGDVFLSAKINDGEEVAFTRQYQLTNLLLRVRMGDKVTFKMLNSGGKQKTVSVTFNQEKYFTEKA